MKKYVVRFEARNAGAIGVLSGYRETVEAEDHALAADLVRQGAYSRGLEHVHVLSVDLAEVQPMNHPTNELSEGAAELLAVRLTDSDLTKATRFLESFQCSTVAVRAVVKALRKQYGDCAAAGLCEVGHAPCADILESVVQALAATEAEEM